MSDQPYSISEFDVASQIAELRRELRMRQVSYPKQVGRGQMTQDQAERQTTALLAAIQTLTEVMVARAAKTDPKLL